MSLEIILGPMFSGKSSRILSIVSRYSALNVPILVIKHSADTRYSMHNEVVTHDGRRVPCIAVDHFMNISDEELERFRVVIIEEGQFFTGLVPFVQKLVDGMGLDVFVVGLDGDFERQPFGEILGCIPLADRVEKLYALCRRCANGKPGIFTHRRGNNQDQVVVGGANIYQALCRDCYHEVRALEYAS
jgi:thymidine kinase